MLLGITVRPTGNHSAHRITERLCCGSDLPTHESLPNVMCANPSQLRTACRDEITVQETDGWYKKRASEAQETCKNSTHLRRVCARSRHILLAFILRSVGQAGLQCVLLLLLKNKKRSSKQRNKSNYCTTYLGHCRWPQDERKLSLFYHPWAPLGPFEETNSVCVFVVYNWNRFSSVSILLCRACRRQIRFVSFSVEELKLISTGS